MKKILHKRKVLKKWVRITIFILLCAICLFAIYLISYGILKKEKQKNFANKKKKTLEFQHL